MNHRKRHPNRSRRSCGLCKPWKCRGIPTERPESERHSDHVRRTIADQAARRQETV